MDSHMHRITWKDGKSKSGKPQNSDEPLSIYETAQKLIDGYTVSGLPISAVPDKVSITDYS